MDLRFHTIWVEKLLCRSPIVERDGTHIDRHLNDRNRSHSSATQEFFCNSFLKYDWSSWVLLLYFLLICYHVFPPRSNDSSFFNPWLSKSSFTYVFVAAFGLVSTSSIKNFSDSHWSLLLNQDRKLSVISTAIVQINMEYSKILVMVLFLWARGSKGVDILWYW